MYLDRSIRGKLEGEKSSSKKVAITQGYRSEDGVGVMRKEIYVGALVQRTNQSKTSDAVVGNYN